MWVRGLKQTNNYGGYCIVMSHPMWVRGLKHGLHLAVGQPYYVAPYVGAWIETSSG